jgi:multicomponent K+:H+ antiporter subunit F
MSAFLGNAIDFASLCLTLAMLFALVRLFRGPAAQDRVLALDAFYLNGMLMLLVLGIRSASTAYFDMALLIALFGFVSRPVIHELLITLFVVMTAPVTAMMLARAAVYRSDRRSRASRDGEH